MKRLLGTLLICTSVMYSQSLWANKSEIKQGGNTMTTIDKPFLALNITFAGCSYLPEINGVDFKQPLGGTDAVVSTIIPINQWLKPGTNTISLKLWPGDGWEQAYQAGQDCEATVKLQVKNARAPTSEYKTIEQFNFHSSLKDITPDKSHTKGTTEAGQLKSYNNLERVDNDGDIKVGPMQIEKIDTDTGTGVKMTREVDLPLPFPKWTWFDGEEIPKNENTKEALFKEYKKIWDALNNNNADSLKDMFQQRDRELNKAFYKAPDGDSVIDSFKKELQNPHAHLGGPLKPEYVHIERKADNKLAALVANTDNDGCIFFNNNKTNISTTYDIWFMKKDGEWQVIR